LDEFQAVLGESFLLGGVFGLELLDLLEQQGVGAFRFLQVLLEPVAALLRTQDLLLVPVLERLDVLRVPSVHLLQLLQQFRLVLLGQVKLVL